MALREINSDAHADARVTTGRAAGPNRVRIFSLWTGHGETAVPKAPTTSPTHHLMRLKGLFIPETKKHYETAPNHKRLPQKPYTNYQRL